MRIGFCLLVSCLMLISLSGFNSKADSDYNNYYIPGKIVFKLTEAASKNKDEAFTTISGLLSNINHAVERKFPGHEAPSEKFHPSGQKLVDLSLIYKLSVNDKKDLDELIVMLSSTNLFEYVEKIPVPELFEYYPDDPLTGNQYYLENIQAFDAWAISQGDTNQVIGIIDTGTDLYHNDLINSIKYNYNDPINGEDSDNDGYIDNFYGWDLGEGNNYPQYNAHSHGVLVSGLASATVNNGTGIAGTGFNSMFMPVKIDDENGNLTKSYEGIIYAADRGVSVMNLSWGGAMGAGQFGQDIINYAVLNRDVVVVAAAGNSDNQVPIYPAAYNNSISVAATDINDEKWSGSSYGITIDVSAPGSGVLTTWPNSQYQPAWGTSFAAPIVSGAAAILRSHFPDYDALQIGAQLKVTTDNIDHLEGNTPYAGLLGTGRINLYRALTESEHPYLKLIGLEHPSEYYENTQPGDYFEISAYFKNILNSANNITASIETNSPYIEVINEDAVLGNAPAFEIVDNLNDPFLFRLIDICPPSHKADFIINFYKDDAYAGRATFSLTLNIDYIDIHPNSISTTITSTGTIGYNYPNFSQGIGFDYNQSGRSLIKCAGIIAGNSTAMVVDNIYGAIEGSFNQYFSSISNAHIIESQEESDLFIKGKFDDSDAGAFMLGIQVEYSIKAWEDEPNNKFIILDYDIINKSGESYNSFYTGFYADWVIPENRYHRASYLPEMKLAYAYSDAGGNYTAIQLLSGHPVNHYAFDNKGFGGSIKISDGFTSFEKYTALMSNRNNAGVYDPDNDISTLLSAGPFVFNPNDTINVAFALIAGDHFSHLLNSAESAYSIFIDDDDDDNGDENGPNYTDSDKSQLKDFVFHPGKNPFTNTLSFSLEILRNTDVTVTVYSISGTEYVRESKSNAIKGFYHFSHNSQTWPPGIYILKIQSNKNSKTLKLIKQ